MDDNSLVQVKKRRLLLDVITQTTIAIVDWLQEQPIPRVPRYDTEENNALRKILLKRLYGEKDKTCFDLLRFTKYSFNMFCELLREKGIQDNSNVTVEESVAMFLLVLGHGVKLRVLGGIYIRSLETISRRFHEVLRLVLSLSKDFIRLPNQVENVDENDHKWRRFKDCLGALDGTHVEMTIPHKDQGRYRNRKQQITTNVLGVCDRKSLKFLYVLSGWEGSSSDSKVL
ncbi:uncharacterized protein LOC124939334 [Impatiens glandulifera]|uniref:uncharacterized protein LOC124939334 n=1 Tax=Impatiens glandulifera TaxID=253017 RepID=UPI001FB09EB3|nr:uncharacterized protein LOC124939334 [Impatiens glandulifera]